MTSSLDVEGRDKPSSGSDAWHIHEVFRNWQSTRQWRNSYSTSKPLRQSYTTLKTLSARKCSKIGPGCCLTHKNGRSTKLKLSVVDKRCHMTSSE